MFLIFQLEEKIDKCLEEQRALIGEREELIGIIEKGNNELKQLEVELKEFYKQHPDYHDDDDQSSVILMVLFVNNPILEIFFL